MRETLDTAVSGKRRRTFKLAAIVLGILPFFAIEAGLRITNTAVPSQFADPFVGFSELHSLFTLDPATGQFKTARSRGMFFGPQSFAAEKSKNGFRGFVLGGSTVRGRPYATDSAFSEWLELELNHRDSTRQYEFINCGGLSYASYRLIPILREVLEHNPDVIIVATGHNEFLEDRTYKDIKQRSEFRRWFDDQIGGLHTFTLARQLLSDGKPAARATDGRKTVLPGEVTAVLDKDSGYASYHYDKPWQQGVLRHFEESLHTMVRVCRQAAVPLVIVRLACNLRDCPPFKSEHPPELTAEDELRWQAAFETGSRLDPDDSESALKSYHQAVEISDDYALLSWRIARCLDRLGRGQEADSWYRRARDQDVCPLRMFGSTAELVSSIAARTTTPVFDAQQALEDLVVNRTPGNDLFMDHVHPTIASHQQIAAGLLDTLIAAGIVRVERSLTSAQRRAMYREHFHKLGDQRFLADGGRRIEWLEHWARRNRLLEEVTPDTSASHLRHGHRYYDLAETSRALDEYEQAIENNVEHVGDLVDRALLLFQHGRTNDAQFLIDFLRLRNDSADWQPVLNFAALMIAVELEDRAELERLSSQFEVPLPMVPPRASAWKQAIPDWNERASRLLDGASD